MKSAICIATLLAVCLRAAGPVCVPHVQVVFTFLAGMASAVCSAPLNLARVRGLQADSQRHSGKGKLLDVFRSVSQQYQHFFWPPELNDDQTLDESLAPVLAKHLKEFETAQIRNEFDQVIFFAKDPWRCCQVFAHTTLLP